MNKNQKPSRQPIWSITQGTWVLYFCLFTTITIMATIFLVFYEIFVNDNTNTLSIIRILIIAIAPIGVGAAIVSIILMEALKTTMVLAKYLEEILVKPLLDKRHQAHEQIRTESREERDALWRHWLNRMNQAQESGDPFDEPPPDHR